MMFKVNFHNIFKLSYILPLLVHNWLYYNNLILKVKSIYRSNSISINIRLCLVSFHHSICTFNTHLSRILHIQLLTRCIVILKYEAISALVVKHPIGPAPPFWYNTPSTAISISESWSLSCQKNGIGSDALVSFIIGWFSLG